MFRIAETSSTATIDQWFSGLGSRDSELSTRWVRLCRQVGAEAWADAFDERFSGKPPIPETLALRCALPREIAEKTPATAQAWFEAQLEGSRPLKEVKILLVGDGGAGKTSALHRLVNNAYQEGQSATKGINDSCRECTEKLTKQSFKDFAKEVCSPEGF